jgi:hypothetical protein
VLSIKELRPLAQGLDGARFEQQLGPFALVQRPPSPLLAAQQLKDLAKRTMVSHRGADASALSLILEFDALVVYLLPPMRTEEELTVGRLPTCDIVLDDPSVSKQHARLRWDAGQRVCTVFDLQSKNGTWINEVQLRPTGALLSDGDVLSFGDVDYWFLLSGTLHGKLQGLPARAVR